MFAAALQLFVLSITLIVVRVEQAKKYKCYYGPETTCWDQKCAMLFVTNATASTPASLAFDVDYGCYKDVVANEAYVKGISRFVAKAKFYQVNESFSCAKHPHMDFVLCTCTKCFCNSGVRQAELAHTFGAIRTGACADSNNKTILCAGECGFAADFSHPHESRVVRGCVADLQKMTAFEHLTDRHLIAAQLDHRYMCSVPGKAQVICTCVGHKCNLDYQKASHRLLREYMKSELIRDMEPDGHSEELYVTLIVVLFVFALALFASLCFFHHDQLARLADNITHSGTYRLCSPVKGGKPSLHS